MHSFFSILQGERGFVNPLAIILRSSRILREKEGTMQHDINCGVSCGVTDCRFNRDGEMCELAKIHVGNTCDCEHCTCCDSFQKRG